MDPQAISKAIPRDNQVDDTYYLQSRDIDPKRRSCALSDLPQTRGLRHETQLQLTILD